VEAEEEEVDEAEDKDDEDHDAGFIVPNVLDIGVKQGSSNVVTELLGELCAWKKLRSPAM